MTITTPAGKLNWNQAYDFVEMFPGFYDLGRNMGAAESERHILYMADRFNFHLRRYLTAQGYTTLHTTLREVRDFVAMDGNAAYHFITLLLQQAKDEMIANEWYELMGRHKQAVKRVSSIITDQHQPTPAIYDFVQTQKTMLRPIYM